MKILLMSLWLISVLVWTGACSGEPANAVENSVPSIQGVWTIEQMEVGTGENMRATVPQAFMLFIMEKHYSAIRDFSPEPRQATSGESSGGSSTGSFMADAGTYEYDGSTLVVHHLVGMMPSMMNRGSSMTFGCRLEGDTLILTPQYDKMVMPGMTPAPSPKGITPAPSPKGKMSYGDMTVHYKFKRLE